MKIVSLILFFLSFMMILIFFMRKRPTRNRMCCLYNYFEKNDQYKDNFEYFLRHGILPTIDYYVIVNGGCSVEIPRNKNMTVYFRENIGYDFGAYSHAIKRMKQKYKFYFFINTSVRGPLLGEGEDPDWTSRFIGLLGGDTRMAGTSINIHTDNLERFFGKKNVYSHVQSMFFVMDDVVFSLLEEQDFFNEDEINGMDLQSVIYHKEVGLSQIVLGQGWNINSILPEYKGLDYRVLDHDINPTSLSGDPYYPGAYFGGTIDPSRVIFFKNNRW